METNELCDPCEVAARSYFFSAGRKFGFLTGFVIGVAVGILIALKFISVD